jgi:hypothetical protein
VQLGNAQFEFVTPAPSKLAPPAEDLYASTSSAPGSTGWQTPDHTGATDYETDNDGSDFGSRLLVTRPSNTAKERVRSIYIQNQYEEPVLPTDQYGFVRQNGYGAQELPSDLQQTQDPKALEAHRARELKVRRLTMRIAHPLLIIVSGCNV